jgi:PAS domain S-box-containing protein
MTLNVDKSLVASEIRYRRLFESAKDGILILDAATGEIVDVNPFLIELLGYSKEQFLGKNLWEVGVFKDIAASKESFIQLQGKKYVRYEDLPLESADGSKIEVEFVSNVYSEDGTSVIQCNIRDITERKHLENKLNRYTVKLEQKSRDLEQLIYVASHDLRSPLVNVQGFGRELVRSAVELIEVIKTVDVPPEKRGNIEQIVTKDIPEALGYIQGGISQIELQLSALLKLSRLGRVAINPQKLAMAEIVADVIKSLEYSMQKKSATIEVSDLPPCMADAVQMNQVFLNLIGNALKFIDKQRPGHIHISGKRRKNEVIYCIEDNGIGIAKEYLDKIFEIFYRVEHQKYPGEGLGLNIVRQCVEKQGGSVRVESEPGKGTRFYLNLPAVITPVTGRTE